MADIISDLVTAYLGNKFPSTFGDPNLNAQLQQRQLDQIQQLQRQGVSLKEQGYNPKALEGIYGAERVAPLYGYEQSDEFKGVAQEHQTWRGLQSAAREFLSRPVQETQTVEGITPDEASGFYPRLRGPGISPAAEVATAAITSRTPRYEDYESRFAQYPALRTLTQGPEAAATAAQAEANKRAVEAGTRAQTRLEQVEIPGAAVAAQNAATAAAQESRLAMQQRLERIRQKRNDRSNLIAHYSDQLRTTHPTLTPEQNRRLARWTAGFGTDASVKDLQDVPGVAKAAPGAITMRDTARELESATQATNDLLTAARKNPAQYTQPVLDSANAQNLQRVVRGAIAHARTGAVQPTAEDIMHEILGRASFAARTGSRYVAKGFNDLDGDRNDPTSEAGARFAQVLAALRDELGGAQSATGVGDTILQRWTQGGNVAPPAAAPAAPAAPAYVGPMTERGASPAPTAIPGAVPAEAPPGYLLGPPAIMPPPPTALEAQRLRAALPRR